MKKVRKIRWHGVMTETLNTQASNFDLGLFGQFDFVCTEVYSVCCQGI